MRIQHNIMAMNAYRNYNNNTKALSGNLEKLSSGYKINRAGDDAAGLAISEKMRAQITGLDAAQKNVKDGISLVKTAEGAMQEIQDMLNRMDYLATQSANGTYQDEVDREALQDEVNQLRSEINRIADSANFNGIKLLDGSLDEKVYKADASVETIEIGGIDSDYITESEGTKGKYTTSIALGNWTSVKAGSTYEFTVSMDDGSSQTVKLTAELETDKDKTGYNKIKYLVAEDGKKYELATAATDGQLSITMSGTGTNDVVFQNAIRKELEKKVGDQFKVTFNKAAVAAAGGDAAVVAGSISFEAKEVGASAPRVTAFDYATVNENGVRTQGVDMGVSVTRTALDAGIEIDVSKLTEYNGENADDAIFTINGHKFVILADDNDTTKNDPDTNDVQNHSYLRAAQALGPDVTILTGGLGGLKAADGAGSAGTAPADKTNPSKPDTGAPDGGSTATKPDGTGGTDKPNNNFTQNIKKIAEVTGLNVTGSLDESDFGPNGTADTGVSYGGGIRLTAGKTETTSSGKALTLQIGDTSDDFNQLKVSVGNMHTYAMGTMDKDGKVTKSIADIDIGTQEGAQAAVDTIKDSINYVSSVRGTLGAIQNRLDHTANNLSVMAENIQDAESTIRDTDVASEMMSYVKNNILVQSAQAMLAQANQVPQGVLQLLG